MARDTSPKLEPANRQLFRGGASAPVVQRLAGHEHLVTTQRYAHVTLGDLEAGIRGLRGNRAAASGRRNR